MAPQAPRVSIEEGGRCLSWMRAEYMMAFRGTEESGCLSKRGALRWLCIPGFPMVGGDPVLDITIVISIPAIFLGAISYNSWILHTFEMHGPEAEDPFRYHDRAMFARPLLGPTVEIAWRCYLAQRYGRGENCVMCCS